MAYGAGARNDTTAYGAGIQNDTPTAYGAGAKNDNTTAYGAGAKNDTVEYEAADRTNATADEATGRTLNTADKAQGKLQDWKEGLLEKNAEARDKRISPAAQAEVCLFTQHGSVRSLRYAVNKLQPYFLVCKEGLQAT